MPWRPASSALHADAAEHSTARVPAEPEERPHEDDPARRARAGARTPTLAQDAQPDEGDIDASFTWSSVDLTKIPAPGGGSVIVTEVHLVVTESAAGPFDKLAGRCLLQGLLVGEDWKSTGACALADADGDLLFEDVIEGGGTGQGKLTGGTGKFAGITGEHAITTTWFSSIREGENQGIGTKTGHWRRNAM